MVPKFCVFVHFPTLCVRPHPVCSFVLLYCAYVPTLCIHLFCDNVHTSPPFVFAQLFISIYKDYMTKIYNFGKMTKHVIVCFILRKHLPFLLFVDFTSTWYC